MNITSIQPRKDGRFLVGLHWNNGVSRRKIMTPDELQDTKDRIQKDREQEAAYRHGIVKAGNVTPY